LLGYRYGTSLCVEVHTFLSEKPVMSPAEARLKQATSEMTDAEWGQRVDLAACYRLIAHYGWDDLVDTHISARVPGPEHHFLINPYGLMFEEITASSLIKIDLDGNQLTKSGYGINAAGFTIHSAIHEAREDAGCVLHLHTPDGTAVASSVEGLLPLNQTAQLVTFDLAYHDYEGIALDHDERPRLQKDLGNKSHMLLRNHGTLTVGRSVASAFERMFHLERACTMQVRTRMLGPTAYPVDQIAIDKNTALLSDPEKAELRSTTLVWPALLRKVDRLDPSYKN
jgi:ribulose-5-phosphate 4-epimerase/fuculose-1-phosphate aldolase